MPSSALPTLPPIAEIDVDHVADLDPSLLTSDTPWVARGLAKHWRLVESATQDVHAGLDYLKSFYRGRPISAFIAESEIQGRFFYNDTLDGFNFTQLETTLDRVINKLTELQAESEPAALYVGSTNVDAWLPGFRHENDLPLQHLNPLVSLWIGNRSRVAPHFDFPRNLACCAVGKRRFTLFPPDQIDNLYIGPWDITPAGQPISLVDTHKPDLDRFPRFQTAWQHAQVGELEPGDVIYIPGMWWHQVEGTEAINVLVNYWWSETPSVMGSPVDAFNHALLSIKSLPPQQKAAWRKFFDHYIFTDSPEQSVAHIPPKQRGRLGDIDDTMARRLRAELTNRLKR